MRYKVYKIKNMVNSKIYIGRTKRELNKRFKEHSNNIDGLIGKDVKIYGIQNFELVLLEECDNRSKANELEIYYISKRFKDKQELKIENLTYKILR